MTLAVLIHETFKHIEQIHIDIDPSKNEIFSNFFLEELRLLVSGLT
jgi:hypothetical protein